MLSESFIYGTAIDGEAKRQGRNRREMTGVSSFIVGEEKKELINKLYSFGLSKARSERVIEELLRSVSRAELLLLYNDAVMGGLAAFIDGRIRESKQRSADRAPYGLSFKLERLKGIWEWIQQGNKISPRTLFTVFSSLYPGASGEEKELASRTVESLAGSGNEQVFRAAYGYLKKEITSLPEGDSSRSGWEAVYADVQRLALPVEAGRALIYAGRLQDFVASRQTEMTRESEMRVCRFIVDGYKRYMNEHPVPPLAEVFLSFLSMESKEYKITQDGLERYLELIPIYFPDEIIVIQQYTEISWEALYRRTHQIKRKTGRNATEEELSEMFGLPAGVIRDCLSELNKTLAMLGKNILTVHEMQKLISERIAEDKKAAAVLAGKYAVMEQFGLVIRGTEPAEGDGYIERSDAWRAQWNIRKDASGEWISDRLEAELQGRIDGIIAEDTEICLYLERKYLVLQSRLGVNFALPEELTAARGTVRYIKLSAGWRAELGITGNNSIGWDSQKLASKLEAEIMELRQENVLILTEMKRKYGILERRFGKKMELPADLRNAEGKPEYLEYSRKWREDWGMVYSEREGWQSSLLSGDLRVRLDTLSNQDSEIADVLVKKYRILQARFGMNIGLPGELIAARGKAGYFELSDAWRKKLLIGGSAISGWESEVLKVESAVRVSQRKQEDTAIRKGIMDRYGYAAPLPSVKGIDYLDASDNWRMELKPELGADGRWDSRLLQQDILIILRREEDEEILQALRNTYSVLEERSELPIELPLPLLHAVGRPEYLSLSKNWRRDLKIIWQEGIGWRSGELESELDEFISDIVAEDIQIITELKDRYGILEKMFGISIELPGRLLNAKGTPAYISLSDSWRKEISVTGTSKKGWDSSVLSAQLELKIKERKEEDTAIMRELNRRYCGLGDVPSIVEGSNYFAVSAAWREGLKLRQEDGMWISPVIEDKRNKEIAGIEAENKGIIVSLKCDYKDLRLPCGAVPELPEYLTAAHGTQDYPALSGKWRRSWEIYYAGSGIWKSRKLDQLKDIQELWRENSLILAALREEYGKLIDDKGMRLYDRRDPGEWRRRWGIVFSERKWHSTIIKDQFIIDALSCVSGLADAEGALADDIRALVLQDLSIVKDLNSRYKDVVLLAAVDVEWRQYRAESELWRSGLELVEFRGVWYSRKLERSRRPDAEPDEAALFLEDLDIKDMLQKKYGLVADLPTSLGGYKSSSLKWRKDWGILRDNNGWVSVSLEDPVVRGRVADDLRIVRILKSRYEKLIGKFLVPFKGPVLAEKASSYLERSNNWRAHWGIVRRGDIIISTTIATRAKDNNVKLEPEDLQPKVKLLQELGYDLRSECEGLSLDENGNIAAESPVRNIPPVPVKPVGVVSAKEEAAAAKPGVPGRREVANISSRDNAIMEKLRKCPLFTVFEAEHSSEALFLFGRVRQLGDKLDAVFQLPGKVDSWREQQVVELVSETSGRGTYRLSAVLIKQLKEAGFSDGGEKQVSLQPSGLKEMLLSKLAYLLGTDRERLKNSKISEKFIIIFLSDDNSVDAEIARSETVLLSGGTLFASWWFVEGNTVKKGLCRRPYFRIYF